MGKQLPQWKCHKIVGAAKIIKIMVMETGATSIALDNGESVIADDAYLKHRPVAGGYFVEYEDGYVSYSPAEAFEKGYTRLPDVTGFEPHQQRVIIEHAELHEKLFELREFIHGNPIFETLPAAEQGRLNRQLQTMNLYEDALLESIEAFSPETFGPTAQPAGLPEELPQAGARAGEAPRVTPADLDNAIAGIEVAKHVTPAGKVLRWAVITTTSGFAVVGKPSVAVSPENDDPEIGKEVAIDNAREELWQLLGYALHERIAAAKPAS
jgi:hypothetical protein